MSVPGCGRQVLIHGMLLVLLRLALALLTLPHRVGIRSIWVMVAAAWLTWAMALSEVANAWWGTTQMLPIAAAQAGASGAESWQELIVSLSHAGAGLTLIAAWALLLVGFLRHPQALEPEPGANPGQPR